MLPYMHPKLVLCILFYLLAKILWKVSLKILNSGLILKTYTHVCIRMVQTVSPDLQSFLNAHEQLHSKAESKCQNFGPNHQVLKIKQAFVTTCLPELLFQTIFNSPCSYYPYLKPQKLHIKFACTYSRPQGHKTFFMLNSTDHEISTAQKLIS